MIVAGSGELMNPDEVLTKAQVARLEKAKASDATVMIRSPQEIADPASRPKRSGTLTWHFRMENPRDVAWSASRSFAWDAARIKLPRSEEHTSDFQSLMRITYAVFCFKKKTTTNNEH